MKTYTIVEPESMADIRRQIIERVSRRLPAKTKAGKVTGKELCELQGMVILANSLWVFYESPGCPTPQQMRFALQGMEKAIDPKKLAFFGRGGTDLAPAIAYAAKLRPCCIVVVSDMDWDWPAAPNPGVPVLWVDVRGNPYEHARPKFGKCIRVEERNA